MKIGNIKKDMSHDMENFRKKNETGIKNTMKGHFSRLEQAETESQNLKVKWKLKEKLKIY
jgi:hypothetical protein